MRKKFTPPYRLKAFTLSEVLITLVIIGIIAAITIPSIIAEYRDSERSARVKKCYTTIANAMTMAQAMGAEMDFAVMDSNTAYMKDWFDSYLKPNLSATKVCYNTNGCWNNGHTKLKDGTIEEFSRYGTGVGLEIVTAILNDGSFINIDAYRKFDIKNKFGVNIKNEYGLVFYFDINGAREPNTIGSDIFAVVYKNGTIVPAFSDRTKAQIEADCSSTGSGRACILKYLKQ